MSTAARPCRVLSIENGAGFGGAIVALESLLSGLSPEQVEVHVISNYPVGQFVTIPAVRQHKVIRDRRVNFSHLAEALGSGGLGHSPIRRAVLFAIGRLDDAFNRFPYLMALLIAVYRIRPDIIHGNNTPLSNREAIIAASLARVPYIQHVRGPLEPSGGGRWLMRRPNAFVPVSKWLEGSLLERGVEPDRIKQTYDALPVPEQQTAVLAPYFRAEFGIPENARVVAMVGMLIPWKGQQLFLSAIARIAQRFPDTYFALIGGTPRKAELAYEQSLRESILSLGLSNRVIMTGIRSDIFLLLREVDAVVSASLDPEPLGLVMLEAMMAGRVFIGPAHGAATEVIQHGVNGFLFQPRNDVALAAAVESFLLAPSAAQEIARRGREDVLRIFRLPQQARRFMEQVTALVSQPRSFLEHERKRSYKRATIDE